jgi:hypothetical protein
LYRIAEEIAMRLTALIIALLFANQTALAFEGDVPVDVEIGGQALPTLSL